jgi:vacuolar-type H+-ATPase subunit E/Vma4
MSDEAREEAERLSNEAAEQIQAIRAIIRMELVSLATEIQRQIKSRSSSNMVMTQQDVVILLLGAIQSLNAKDGAIEGGTQ